MFIVYANKYWPRSCSITSNLGWPVVGQTERYFITRCQHIISPGRAQYADLIIDHLYM